MTDSGELPVGSGQKTVNDGAGVPDAGRKHFSRKHSAGIFAQRVHHVYRVHRAHRLFPVCVLLFCALLSGCRQSAEPEYSVNGVSERSYPEDSRKFKSFGMMHLQTSGGEPVDCPEDIAARAYGFAVQYKNSDTEYAWGGQDPLRTIRIDCSGLVVRCYQYAVAGTEYDLLFADETSAGMKQYSTETENPRAGDLIFMGDENSDTINHIAIYARRENGRIYFIDSTQK